MKHLSKLSLRKSGKRLLDGTTASGQSSRGTAAIWEATGVPGVAITVADVRWVNGERDVRAVDVVCPLPIALGGPRPLARLERGSRLSVLTRGAMQYVELQVSRIDPSSPEMWSSTYKADENDFRLLLGDHWKEALLAEGATGVGSRESLIGDDGRRRRFLCAVMQCDDSPLPVMAYFLTRVLPLLDLWSPVHPVRNSRPNEMRVYVVELDEMAPGPPSARGAVYVGDTARNPEDRLATHLGGGRTAAKIVARTG